MPYPLASMPPFSEFRDRLINEFGCLYKSLDDNPFQVNYFERENKGKKLNCTVSFEDENEILTPTMLRHICRRLEIDPTNFGLHLG